MTTNMLIIKNKNKSNLKSANTILSLPRSAAYQISVGALQSHGPWITTQNPADTGSQFLKFGYVR